MSFQNLTTDNFNSALHIAALAQFSKSCGLITDKDYNKLISENTKAAYKGDFASETSAIFNNGGKTALSNDKCIAIDKVLSNRFNFIDSPKLKSQNRQPSKIKNQRLILDVYYIFSSTLTK